tara:strand:- start:56 stop:223 length:168 start_codon:yes stop_codon:yes gene_type:complete
MLYSVTFIPRKYALAEDPSDYKEWQHVEADTREEAQRIGEETLGMVVRVENEVKF